MYTRQQIFKTHYILKHIGLARTDRFKLREDNGGWKNNIAPQKCTALKGCLENERQEPSLECPARTNPPACNQIIITFLSKDL